MMTDSTEALLRIVIEECPVPQPRPRAFSAGPFRSRIVSAPHKHPVHRFKRAIAAEIERLAMSPVDGPLGLSLLFRMPRPKNKIWKRRPMPRESHSVKPDLDNLAKSVMDAANGLLWYDDSQVMRLEVAKWLAAGDESPGVELELWKLSE